MAKPEEEQTMGKRLKQLIRQGVFLLVSSFSLIALSYAWFNYQKNGQTDELEFVSITSVGFEASLDGETYYDSLELEFPENLHMTPVSGDGRKGSMYYPVLPPGSDDPAEATSWVSVDYDENADDNAFYRVHVYFRADVAGYVALTGIGVNPAAEPDKRQSSNYQNAKGEMVEVSSVDRPFEGSLIMPLDEDSTMLTRDYMAAATRVSITNTGVPETGIAKHFIVIPNAGYKLTVRPNISTHKYSLQMTESNNVDQSQVWYHYYDENKLPYGVRDFNYYYDTQISESQMQYVLRLKEATDGSFKGEVDICLWVEGFDEEACDVFADGRMTMNLSFKYVESAPES